MTTTYSPAYFEQIRRADTAEPIIVLTDDAPEWLRDAVYVCHEGMLPDDWTYATCAAIVDALTEWADDTTDADEIADALTEIYTAPLMTWAADNLGWVDDALAENPDMASGGIVPIVSLAQAQRIAHMVDIIRDAATVAEQEAITEA